MDKARLTFLFEKARKQTITDDERVELFELLGDRTYEKEVNRLFDEAKKDFKSETVFFTPEESEAIFTVLRRVTEPVRVKPLLLSRWTWWAAAMALLIVSYSAYLYLRDPSVAAPSVAVMAKQAIQPGKNQATLHLGNGQIVDLNAIGNQPVQEGGVTIHRSTAGQLVYQVDHQSESDPIQENILTTPRGGQFQVVLPDGTQVWLGASSSLRYPTRFGPAERTVFLEGEAYFEIAKDEQQPFYVQSKGATVQVLGTHFSLTAYPDVDEVGTSLFEGKVRVLFHENAEGKKITKVLNPGDQATVNRKTMNLTLRKIDVEDALAWKKGYFIFHGDDIKTVMRTVARWYDVEVVYQGDLSGETFIGTVSKFDRIEKLLETIELTGGVHFKIEGRQIIVMK